MATSVGRRVAVVGAGVSGLTVAHRLVASDPAVAVHLVDPGPPGGKVETIDLAGLRMDTGPDALMVRMPALGALVDEIGLRDAVRAPALSGPYLWTRGRLRPLPMGSVFGIPDKVGPLLRSRVIRPPGLIRAAADLALPRTRVTTADPTVAELLRPRLGREVFERIVDPLLGGVHAGRAERLSARSAVPEVARLLDGSRSAFLTVRRAGKARPPASGPALVSLAGGLSALTDALAARVTADGGRVHWATVTALAATDSGWQLTLSGADSSGVDEGATLVVDQVVLATPAHVSGSLLGGLDPALGAHLAGIEAASVATVLLAYDRGAVDLPPGTGFLVPPVEGRLIVGCTWMTSKWPHLATPDGPVVIRCMVGRDGDDRWAALSDAALLDALRGELAEAMGSAVPRGAKPVAHHIRRMPIAMPQYTVGHADRLTAIDARVAEHPGLHLTGAGYRGVGISGCVTAAETVAREVLSKVGSP